MSLKLILNNNFKQFRRLKSTLSTKDRALDNLDNFYGSIYGKKWPSIRVALLTEHKYLALLNNFGDLTKTKNKMESIGAIHIKSVVEINKNNYIPRKMMDTQNHSYEIDNIINSFQEKQPAHEDASSSTENRYNESVFQDRLVDSETSNANLYEYVPANKIRGMEDWIPESHHYRYYKTSEDFPLKFSVENNVVIPDNIHLYIHEIGNTSDFITPLKCSTGLQSYYLMDGASILPVIALGSFKPEDKVLDACSAPGGKSLLILQTMIPKMLVSNDISQSRTKRIHKVMNEYILNYDNKWLNKIHFITKSDARFIDDYNTYDKILVDVPCTTDRHSLNIDDNNIFKGGRIKERLRLPELQSEILSNCIKLLKPGGTVVYSTCSLSPVQNDGVVHMALQKIFNESGITCTINDLSIYSTLFKNIFQFDNSQHLKYGQLVIPYLPANMGPMYFSKITKDEI